MPLILDREKVLEIYNYASNKGWVLPAFNTENLTTTEAILSGACAYGESIGISDLPIIIGITNNYPDRPQSQFYTQTRQWQIGLNLFLTNLEQVMAPGSPFSNLKVMIHLDHILWDKDAELLNWDMGQFSSIMFDASDLTLDENIQKTTDFVKKNNDKIIIEGACDEIGKVISDGLSGWITPDIAERYYLETGVDIVVVNLGTEHRSSSASLKYHDQLAREISERIGSNLCLHGTSSIPMEKLSQLFENGIKKVNIWTSLERDSTPDLFHKIVQNAAKVAGPEKVKELIDSHMLGNKSDTLSAPSVDFFTTTYRQDIVFKRMKDIVISYLKIWYK